MRGMLLGRVRGIEIRVGWSVAIVAWLITWSLATQVLPDAVAGRSDAQYWFAGGAATIGFLAALVAHELGHAVVAQSHSVTVRSITLWVLGGVARMEKSPPSAGAAMQIAAAGPAVSLACGVIGVVAGALGSGLVGAVLIWFGSINLLLAGFNLLPAYPLDGGRVYQAWLWKRGMTEELATTRAARLGSRIGQGIVWIGVVEILFVDLLGGLWLMFVGWFIREASHVEEQHTVQASILHRYTAGDVMTPNPSSVPDGLTIEQFVDVMTHTGRHAAYPVHDRSGAVVGLIEVKSVRAIPRPAWSTTRVAEVMKPLRDVPVARPDDALDVLADTMRSKGDTRGLMIEQDRLVGIVAPSDIARLMISVELRGGPSAPDG